MPQYPVRLPRGTCGDCVSHICRTCGKDKPAEEFYARKRPDGSLYHRRDCKECVREHQKQRWADDPEAHRVYGRTYYHNNAWRVRDSSLRKKYGITYADFVRMHEEQGGKCALCQREIPLSKAIHVDHDHKTGKVRALLCHHCNTGLGNLQDDPDLLLAAALYVLRHREEHRDVVATQDA